MNLPIVVILCGGRGPEHEVSLISAGEVYKAVDTACFAPKLVAIDKNGTWRQHPELILHQDQPDRVCINPSAESFVPAARDFGGVQPDIVFNIIHGTHGEDGCLQGYCELFGIAYVGSSVLGSAICMDKEVCKRLLLQEGIPVGDFLTVRSHREKLPYESVVEQLGSPFFLKPACAGSSVGVHKCAHEQEYDAALAQLLPQFDKLILEKAIDGRELEVAVLGNTNPQTSDVGEIVTTADFYSYSAKYTDPEASSLILTPDLSSRAYTRLTSYALRAFQALECSGLARVDFFLDKDDNVILNEVNTLPGFTPISMYPKLFAQQGIRYDALVSRLIRLGLNRCYNSASRS